MAAAKKIAMEISRDKGMPYINGYDHPHIMAGMHVESILRKFIVLKINFRSRHYWVGNC
jgi:hypothetical protein